MKIDRRAIAVRDLVEAEEFYVGVLGEVFGAYLANRYMLTTDEQILGRKAAAVARRNGASDDAEDMALPYSRVILGAARQAHVYLQLSARHRQEPPLDQLKGTPRLALAVTPEQIGRAADVLQRHGVAFDGPVSHRPPSPTSQTLYLRDRSGNFLELSCPAERTGFKGGEFQHVVLQVCDLHRTGDFYERVIGLQPAGEDLFPDDGPHASFALDDGAHLVLAQVAEPAAASALDCSYFSLANDEWPGLVERLKSAGCEPVADPRGGLRGAGELRLRVRDPDGHALELHTFEDSFYEIPPAGRGKIAVGRVDDFPIGSVTRVPRGKFYLVRLEEGFLAISEVCTHRQFTVAYQPEHYCFACPLHGNRYSRTGKLIHRGAREATPPLHVYRITFANDMVVVDTDESIPRTEEEAETMERFHGT